MLSLSKTYDRFCYSIDDLMVNFEYKSSLICKRLPPRSSDAIYKEDALCCPPLHISNDVEVNNILLKYFISPVLTVFFCKWLSRVFWISFLFSNIAKFGIFVTNNRLLENDSLLEILEKKINKLTNLFSSANSIEQDHSFST